jgi:tetratricopeptide (TPR) repeat protein
MKQWTGRGIIFFALLLWLAGTPVLETQVKRDTGPEITPDKPEPGQLGETIPDWQARLELARLLSHLKKYDESITEYQKVLSEKPDSVEARAELGRVLFWSGQRDQALKTLELIPPEKMDDQSRAVLADLYGAQKKYAKAEALYRDYLDKHPDDLSARLKLAELLSWSKRYRESLDQYEIILRAQPDDLQVRRKYALVLSWAGRKAEAIKELRKTLEP